MRKILKRFFTTDRSGRVLASNTERLTDNGRDRLSVTTRRAAIWCPSCRRPVTDVNGLRGRCDYCRIRSCCEHCETRCQVCSRRLCGHCRRGFVGNTGATVCPFCLVRMRQRQAFQDRLLMQIIVFQRQILRQREITRLRALQLQAAKMRTMGQLQAARIRMMGQLALVKEINRLRLALAKESRRGGRYLR